MYRRIDSLVEKWRYRYTISKAVIVFIEHWAHQHSGLYKPSDSMVNDDDFKDVAIPLSHELSRLMLQGLSDPIAYLLSEYARTDSKHLSYYPTPPELGRLVAKLLAIESEGMCSIAEPCCGSAGVSMEQLESLYFERVNSHEKPLSNVNLVVEDISSLQCHAYFIQLLHKLQYLKSVGGKCSNLASVRIQQIDVLSRQKGSVLYLMTDNIK